MKPKKTEFEPQTVGEHIKKRRLLLKLTQKTVARMLKVSQFSIINWERGDFQPANVFTLHRIIQFLGYDPLPKGDTIREMLRQKRRERGWGQRDLAAHLGVDRATVAQWELRGTILKQSDREKVAGLLGLPEERLFRQMRAQWNQRHGKAAPTHGG